MKNIRAVEIEINSNCNRKCSYCPNTNQIRIESGDISTEVFDKILSELKKIEFKGRISFSFYNEPLLSSKVELYTKKTKTELPGCNILIYTNGTLLTVDKFYSMINAGVDYFVVTKHEKETFNYEFDNTIKIIPPELLKLHVKYQNFSELKFSNRGGLIEINSEHKSVNLPCAIPIYMITITNQGSVLPCFEDYHQLNQMGNITESSLEEIWNSEKYIVFRKTIALGLRAKYPVCSTCNRINLLDIY